MDLVCKDKYNGVTNSLYRSRDLMFIQIFAFQHSAEHEYAFFFILLFSLTSGTQVSLLFPFSVPIIPMLRTS